ncbi:MAG: hypothetical protein ACM3OB_07450 [Acidobacteriota bacterium]
MRRSRNLAILIALVGVAALFATSLAASNTVAKKEGLACTVCHDKPGSKLLTDKGKYYESAGTLAGYDKVAAAFGNCTYCHDRRPGSKKLTARGEELRSSIKDMKALRDYVLSAHPPYPKSAPSPAPPPPQ